MSLKDCEKISIIVPAYCVEKYIKQCLECLIHQTYSNLEIIVVDDGSTDATGNILKEYAKLDSRIIVIQQDNQGVSQARNRALERATGEYCMFVDSDDWLDLQTCEELITIAKHENADIVMFGYIREYEDNSLPKAIFDEEKIIFNKDEIQENLHRRIFGPIGKELKHPERLNALSPVCMKLYRTNIIKDFKFVDINEIGVCEDGLFNIYAFDSAQKVCFIKKYFYHYRKIIASGSLTQKQDNEIFQKTKKFYNNLLTIIDRNNLSDVYRNALNNRLSLSLIENGITIINANKDVKGRRKKSCESIKTIITDDNYKIAIKDLETKYMPFHWKIFFLLSKMRCTFGVYVLLKVIVKMMNKK